MKIKMNFEKYKEGYTCIRYYKEFLIWEKVVSFKVIRNLLETPFSKIPMLEGVK